MAGRSSFRGGHSGGDGGQRLAALVARRVQIAIVFLGIALAVLITRLWYLQVIRGEHYRIKSENNRIRTVYVAPPRGRIYDRDGVLLASNRPSFNIELIPEDARSPKLVAEQVATLSGIPLEEVLKRMNDTRTRRRFEPRILLKDVSRDTVARIAGRRYELPGVVVNVEPAREYIHGDFAAHVLGYIREISSEQLKQPTFARYRPGDMVGQFGIEAKYESLLQGERGVENVIVDAAGNRIGESTFQEEQPGNDVVLTISYPVQAAADAALADRAGAIVALDVANGDVLALSSSPRFDPNEFATDIPADRWRELMGPDSGKPMTNRVLQGAYPPGSVFKMIVGAAALAERVIGANDRISCPGFLPFGGRNFGCHKRTGHGPVNLFDAMVMSCDVYFYTVGNRLDVDRIHDYATRFGLGIPSGLELADEARGTVPSRAWKQRYYQKKPEMQRWFPGETLSVAIGQGAMTSTPIQLARATAALVNGGFLVKPHLVRQVRSRTGTVLEDHSNAQQERESIGIDPKVLKTMQDTMVGVVNDQRGTGRRAQMPKEFNILVGGKTGTSQVVSLAYHRGGGKFEHHGWFVGFAPADKPEIVVAALAEHGGGGGSAAAPLVHDVLEAYFLATRPELRQLMTTQKPAARVIPPAPESPSEPELPTPLEMDSVMPEVVDASPADMSSLDVPSAGVDNHAD